MPVAMRLMRMGTTHHPVYRISIGDSRKRPTAKFIEHIGTYNPTPDKMGHKQLRLNVARAKYWIAMGCQPSSIVSRLLSRFHLLPVPPQRIVVPTGPLLHRVLAGEDVRAELAGGMRVLPAEEQQLPHRIPIARRRFDEVTPERVETLTKQAPWKLQAFNFDPAPTPATWAAWDQARVFHRQVFPHPQHPAPPALSFREKLKAEDVRNYRRHLREEDITVERSEKQKAQDLEDDAEDAFFLREKMQAAGFQPVIESDRITITSAEQYEKDLEQEKMAYVADQEASLAENAEADELTEGEEITDESLIEGEHKVDDESELEDDDSAGQVEDDEVELIAQDEPRTLRVRSPSEKRAELAALAASTASDASQWASVEAELLADVKAAGLDPDMPLEELLKAFPEPKKAARKPKKTGIAGKKKHSKKMQKQEKEEDDDE